MKLRPYQSECLRRIDEGFARHGALMAVMATGLGKCLGKGTPVLMHDGTVRAVEDIPVGGLLMGPDSKPRRVLSLARGRESLYRVVPTKGDPYVVNESHLLSLKLTPARAGRRHELVAITVRDYLAQGPTFRHRAKGWRAAVDWPTGEVPLHPYLLGLWLGDGNARRPAISKPDPEVEAAVRAFGTAYGLRVANVETRPSYCPTWAMIGTRGKANPVFAALRSLGVVEDRQVPLAYRANSRAVRLDVLAGLLDSDGHLSDGCFDYVSRHRRLAEDVAFLARSLGLAAYIAECEKGCQNGHRGTYHRVCISGDCSVIPTRIRRRKAPPRRQIKDVLVTGIRVEPVGVGDYYGFEIDGDRLFLLGDFTVTHNTVVFSHLASSSLRRVLILAHRDELIQQAAQKVRAICGLEPGVEMGEARSPEDSPEPPRVVVSSVQTMCRPNRQKRFRPADFDLLVIDEAHHAVARSYRDSIGYFRQNPDLRLLGVTATPARADKLAMGQVFDAVAYEYGIEAAVADGWLVPPHQRAIVVEGLDFSHVRSLAGDLSAVELEEVLSREKVLHATAAPAVELAGDLPALVFCATVAHARLMAEVLCRYKPGSAIALDGTTHRDRRREVVEAFRRGEVQFLCNCGLFLEGFDAPSTAVVVMARPTKSLALYTQILGRGTRPLPGVVDFEAPADPSEAASLRRSAIARSAKPSMLILDFVGNSGRHRIVTASDLLGGKYGEPARAYARKLAEGEGPSRPVEERLAQAADELALLAEVRERRRLAAIRASRAEYTAREVSPFGRSGGGSVFAQGGQVFGEPVTEKQGYFLLRRGWRPEKLATLSKRQASAIISKIKEQEAARG